MQWNDQYLLGTANVLASYIHISDAIDESGSQTYY